MLYTLKKIKIHFHFSKIDSEIIKEILGYSFFVFIGIIVDQIYWNTDQFLLGVYLGTIPVAIYAIAMQFIILYMRFSTSISGLFLPKVSMMVAKNASSKDLTEMMIKFGRLQFIVLAFILGGFVLYGFPFINLWAGSSYNEAYSIVLIIMIPLSIPLIQNIGISILYAKNLQKFRSLNLIFIAILNVIITIPLINNFGGRGAAFATAISLLIGNGLIMNIYYYYKVKINIILFWKNILKISFPVFFAILVSFLVKELEISSSVNALLINILIYSFVFSFLIWLFGFNEYEKSIFKSILNTLKKITLKIFRKRNSVKDV